MAIKKFCQAHFCDFRDKCVVFACNFKFANLIQYDMQYIPCNNALLAQETLLLSQRSTLCEGASCLRKTSATLNDIHTKTDSRKIPTLTPKKNKKTSTYNHTNRKSNQNWFQENTTNHTRAKKQVHTLLSFMPFTSLMTFFVFRFYSGFQEIQRVQLVDFTLNTFPNP